MSTHIKRDGAWLCKRNPKSMWNKNDSHVTFKQAHNAKLNSTFIHKGETYFHYCQDCVKRYYEIVDNLPDVLIIK